MGNNLSEQEKKTDSVKFIEVSQIGFVNINIM